MGRILCYTDVTANISIPFRSHFSCTGVLNGNFSARLGFIVPNTKTWPSFVSHSVNILRGFTCRSWKGGLKRNKDTLSSDPNIALAVSKAVLNLLSSFKESAAAASGSCITWNHQPARRVLIAVVSVVCAQQQFYRLIAAFTRTQEITCFILGNH